MNMPKFNAESSLGPSMATYQGKAIFSRAGSGEVSLQQFGASSFKGRFGMTMRCCGYSTVLHRFVCTSQDVSPLEQCQCQRDFFGHPVIICRPPVISPDLG